MLQECRIFDDANVVTNQPRKCCQLITKLLHILTQGDRLSSGEATGANARSYSLLHPPRSPQ